MEKKLYVGNLSYETTGSQLETLFAQVGAVAESVVITDRETGQSKGFGFVEMADEQGAQAGIERFNGAQVDGRSIKVAAAQPRANRDDRFSGAGQPRRSW